MGVYRRHWIRGRDRLRHVRALAARVNSIKYHFNGSEFRSTLDRSREDQAVLSAHGGKIQGLNLQSYLFFGSANAFTSTPRRYSPAIRSAGS